MRCAIFSRPLVALVAITLVGCGGSPEQPSERVSRPTTAEAPTAPITNTDPCAMRLHDLSGGLLLYHFFYGRLPDALDELADFDAGPEMPPAVCPVSQRPYAYRPEGIYLPEQGAQVVLHDPAPSHANVRWAVTLRDPGDGEPLVTKVIWLPESFFLLHPARP